jgi:hypothetical protein
MINDDTKYSKVSRRVPASQTRSFLLALLFPAAATVTTDVWIHTITVSSNFNHNFVLAIVNVSGAFLDGFFSAFESGDAIPIGPKTEALHLVAVDMRTFGLSTYTSWAGMISVAASMGFARSNVLVGLVYVLMCIGCGCAAHGLGSDLAQYVAISAHGSILDSTTNPPYNPVRRAQKIVDAAMVLASIYIFVSYVYVELTEPQQKFWSEATPSNQLVVSILFAMLGASTGNIVSKLAPANSQFPTGTVICNATFSLLSLSTNLLRVMNPTWSESLILKAFATNFCGAASVFSRHISGLSLLYSTSSKRSRLVLSNVLVNLLFAGMVYWIALEIEVLLHDSENIDAPKTATANSIEQVELIYK